MVSVRHWKASKVQKTWDRAMKWDSLVPGFQVLETEREDGHVSGASQPPHLPPPETDASFSFPVASPRPLFGIDLLLMPKHHRGRLTKGVELHAAAWQASPSPKQEVWFTSAAGRELSSGDLGANGPDLCVSLLLWWRGTSLKKKSPSSEFYFSVSFLCFDC